MRKGRQRRQVVSILTETNSAVDDKLEVEVGRAVSERTLEAWGLDANQQAQDEKTGAYIQVVCERTYKPVRIFNFDGDIPKDAITVNGKNSKDIAKSNIDAIASQQAQRELVLIDQKKPQHRQLLYLFIITGMLTLALLALVAVAVEKSGGFNLGGMFKMSFVFPVLGSLFVPKKKQVEMEAPEVTETSQSLQEKLKKKYKKMTEKEIDRLVEVVLNPSEISHNGLKKHKPNCRISVDRTKYFYFRYVHVHHIPNESRERNYNGKPMHYLNCNEKGKLAPILIPEAVVENESPKDLYLLMRCIEKPIGIFLSMADSIWEKMKYIFFYVLIIFEIVIIFMLIESMIGGTVPHG